MNEKIFMTIREVAKTGILPEHTIRVLLDICLRTSEQMDILERIVAIEESLAECK